MGAVLAAAITLLVTVATAAPPPDETPARPGEWGFRPADGSRALVDPPAFVWRPQKDARSYAVEVRTAGGTLAHEAAGLTLLAYCPPRTLGPGRYVWRFRLDGGAWSTDRRFEIPTGATAFPLPTREEILGRIPEGHPRIFFRPEDLPRLRELAKGRLRDRWTNLAARCERLLAKPVDVSEPFLYQAGEVRGVNDDAKIWWGNRTYTIRVLDGAATLGFAWRISGDRRYAEEGRRLLLGACAWNPRGATGYRYNDEAGMPFAWAGARAYTWLHDVLTEEDRARVRAVMAIRMGEMARHLIGRHHLWRPYSSHANRAWHWLGEVGAAFHGELEGADDAVWFAMNVFHAAYPVWSDDAGGWHEGLAYWNSYLGRAMTWMLQMEAVLGHDGFRKPFFSRAGDFALYVAPPGETMGGFGDLTLGYAARRCGALMGVLARMAGNASWQWYVDESGGPANPGGYLGFLFGARPEVEARAPVDRPSSIVFPGTGVAVLHRDLVDRANDVQLMLKSSPMGSQSHGYESQNAFLLSVAGEPIFIRSGRRDLYGSPHHRRWMWSTRSVNSLLVDGQPQRMHTGGPLGRITTFSTSRDFDHVEGEAAAAYGGRLERFTRAVLFLKPDVIVMFDAVEAKVPSTFQWLLHSPREMAVEGQTIRAEGKTAGAILSLLAPGGLVVTQTDRFDPPPRPWVKLRQWHLTAATEAKRRNVEFVTLIRPYRTDRPLPPLTARALSSSNAVGAEIELAGGRAWVAWRLRGDDPMRIGPLETFGHAAAVVVDPKGRVVRAYLSGAALLTHEGERVPVDLLDVRPQRR